MGNLESRMVNLESRMVNLESRMVNLESRMINHESRMINLGWSLVAALPRNLKLPRVSQQKPGGGLWQPLGAACGLSEGRFPGGPRGGLRPPLGAGFGRPQRRPPAAPGQKSLLFI